ncbi:AsmA family protein [Hymenobacter terrenus]|uniref:hypothetical protein n=1 Tax=Hymenobacter terrenus TaxID=1629124 RepID=UPI0006198261|nr:hypothetical protein [Hymenobacter terrenus]
MPEKPVTSSSNLPTAPIGTPGRRRWHWGRWLLGLAGLLMVLALVAPHFLDPWLRRTWEKQVSEKTHGQYRLQVGMLHTSVLQRAIRLSQVRLCPAAVVADTLPRIRLDVAQLHVTGVGLLALWRKGLVRIDSVVLDSARIEVLALAKRPTKGTEKPVHEQLPLNIKGLNVGYFGLLHTQANYLPNTPSNARFQRADLAAHELLISPAGAADSQRLSYAAAWSLRLLRGHAQAAGHQVALGSVRLSTEDQQLQLDSVRILPAGPRQPQQVRVDLALQRLRLSGLNAAALQRHQFRADSLLIQRPRLTLTLSARASPNKPSPATAYLRRLDLAHFAMHNGYLRVAGTAEAPVIRSIDVAATAIHFASGSVTDTRRVFFANAWEVALGQSQATVAAHALTLGSMHLSTRAGRVALRSVRIRPPGPGQGKAGAVRVDLIMPGLVLTGLDAAALQHQRHFRAKSLVVAGPRLNFKPPTQPPPPVWKLLAKFLRRFDLAQFRVQHAGLQVGGLRHSPEMQDLNLTAQGIRIDSLAALEPRRLAYARAWQASSGLVTAPFDPPYYRAAGQRMRLDTEAHSFVLEDITLKAKYSAMGMNLHKRYQAPAINLSMTSLAASGLDYAALFRGTGFRMARLMALNPVLRIASDGRGPINPNLSKITPETMISLRAIIDVRRFDIRNGNLYSWYRSPLTPIPGTMNINRFNGSFFNLSNDPKRQTPATPLTGRATTYLQNRCQLDAQLSMYLLDPQGRHRVWGAFGPSSLTIINSMTEPTRLVKFKSGDVRRLRFELQADRKRVTGTMWTEYSGLQMTLLSYKEEAVQKTLFSRLKSKAANVIVIRDENPRKSGELVAGEMTSTREPRFSVFTLWRQGIVSGLFNNVGIPQKLAQKLSETKDEGPLPDARR